MLLFARAPECEARVKGLRGAAPVFRLTLRRLRLAAEKTAAELIVVGTCWQDRRPPGCERLLAQRGESFGERLANAFADVFALGFDRVVAVGIDTPGLRPSHLDAAFGSLERAPAVLGPDADGGVYLIGLARAEPGAFSRVSWQTRDVLADLQRALADSVTLPQSIGDLDSPAGLGPLAASAMSDQALLRLLLSLVEPVQPGRHAEHHQAVPCPATAWKTRAPPPDALAR